MTSDEVIHKLIRDTGKRARREIGACLFILVFFGWYLQRLPARTIRYDGCLLILIAAVFIAVVVWAFTLNKKFLHDHPVGDSVFWRKKFQDQARLLRWVPLWYLGPLGVGMLMFLVPMASRELMGFVVNLSLMVVIFVWAARLNWSTAKRIEADARMIGGQ
jgi:hypothetical protein